MNKKHGYRLIDSEVTKAERLAELREQIEAGLVRVRRATPEDLAALTAAVARREQRCCVLAPTED